MTKAPIYYFVVYVIKDDRREDMCVYSTQERAWDRVEYQRSIADPDIDEYWGIEPVVNYIDRLDSVERRKLEEE